MEGRPQHSQWFLLYELGGSGVWKEAKARRKRFDPDRPNGILCRFGARSNYYLKTIIDADSKSNLFLHMCQKDTNTTYAGMYLCMNA